MSLEEAWYKKRSWLQLLRPLEWLFVALAKRRRQQYRSGKRESWKAPVPVLVVGNISVGGTGKSPLVIWLIEQLRQQGFKPGVVSRGYKAKPLAFPYLVTENSSVVEAGDEPQMIVRRTGVPMVIDPDRVAAAKYLLQRSDCDLIISDDGLQHYALQRTVEIAVLDGKRGVGNGYCLPAGPLREPVSRLSEVDLIVVNSGTDQFLPQSLHHRCYSMSIAADSLQRLDRSEAVALASWVGERHVHAVAGIGNPQRFYDSLADSGFTVIPHSFSDHYQFTESDLHFDDEMALIMTEKDAVKCDHMALENSWYLQINAVLDKRFLRSLLQAIEQNSNSDRLING